MFTIQIDDLTLQRRFSDLETKQLPFATVGALNDAMFAVVRAWKAGIHDDFDAPVQRTINAVRYTKATKATLTAEVFIAGKGDVAGTPPARYLEPETAGGFREEKPFEHLMRQAGILAADEFVVPARGFPMDAFGNVPGGIVNAILSDLQSSRDPIDRSNRASRGKRARRRDVGKRAIYFASSPKLSASQGRKQHLPRAIYQRTSFAAGSAIRMAFIIVKGPPTYRSRFDAQRLAQKAFSAEYPLAFNRRLDQGVRTAKIR